TSASRRGSLKLLNQPPATAPGAPPGALHCRGGTMSRSASLRNASRSGGDFNVHPAAKRSSPAAAAPRMIVDKLRMVEARISVHLEDQPVELRSHPHDDLADDMDHAKRIRVHGAITHGACSKEQTPVPDLEFHGNQPRWHLRYGGRKRPGDGQLSLASRPDDGIDLALDYLVRIGLERDLRFVSRFYFTQFVLAVQRDDPLLGLDETHDRQPGKLRSGGTGAQLDVDGIAVGRREHRGLVELP